MCLPALAASFPSVFGTAAAGTAAATAGSYAASALGTAAGFGGATAAMVVPTVTAATTGLTTAQMISLGLSAAGAATSVIGAYQQAKVAGEVAARNAKIADMQAEDALRRGENEAAELRRRVAATKSAQRVSLAAKGLDLTYGTAADLQDQTDFFGESDVATVRTNARKEAWSRRSQSANFQAEALSQRPWLSAGSTLLAGAGQVADKWYAYKGR
jgi:hypothetical protein